MKAPFPWQCPFCDRHVIVTDERLHIGDIGFDLGSRHGLLAVRVQVIACPNPACREIALTAYLHPGNLYNNYYVLVAPGSDPSHSWPLLPPANIRVFPDYIPAPLLADYQEACLIRELSPKASATLARRCLQGMIRDFWQISKPTLYKEIEAIEDKLDPLTWKALDSVRRIGNIGAHMEADINLVVEVDPNEAQLLIELIETLFSEWYVARHERVQRMERLVAVAQSKKHPPALPPSPPEDVD